MPFKRNHLIFNKFNWICLLGVALIDLCYGNISPAATGVTSLHHFSTKTAVATSSILPDPCASGLDNCTLEVANCIPSGSSYYCQCLPGFTGNGRGANGCVDLNECSLGLCDSNAICINTAGNYTCACKFGYTGNGKICTDIDECLNSVCDNNANCSNTPGSYTCTCNPGFFVENNICYDINECTSGVHKCVEPAFCNNQIPSYSCLCPNGFTSSGQFTCENINECLSSTLNNCDENADCIDNDGSYSCQCKIGFTGDGAMCTDINECINSPQPCDNNAQCTNTAGSFQCICNSGYVGSGKTCTDFDECSNSTTNFCIDPAVCVNNVGSYQCNCPIGYTKNNQFACFDVNECLSSANCPVSSVCENTLGSFKCLCNAGFHGNDCTDINECSNSSLNRCASNALCTNSIGSYSCECKTGFEGDGFSCDNINECLQVNNCSSAANCVDDIGSYSCSCITGYSGDGFTCSDINECLTNNPCDQQCTNIPGSYQCSCNTGYEFTAPHTCTNINECLFTSTNDCNLNALCSDTPGSYNCTCNSGYLGDGKDCVVDYFVPYKSGNFIQNADVNQPIVRIQSIDGFPISGALFHDLYVCVNGFLSVGLNICEEGPFGDLGTPLSDGTIFAPYWTDIDTTISNQESLSNRVYYSSFEEQANNAEAVSVKSSVQSMIQSKTSVTTFTPTYVAVITWFEVTPYPSTIGLTLFNSSMKATFQCVLTTDGVNTFVYYVYYNMLWDDPYDTFKVQVGYRFNPSLSLVPNVVSPYGKLRFDKAPGNVGVNGLWIFQVSNSTNNNAANECNQWKDSLPSADFLAAYINFRSKKMKRRMSCPCSIQQAVYDRRYEPEDFLLHTIMRCIFRKGKKKRNCLDVDGSKLYCIQRKNIWYTNLRNKNGDKYAVVTRCCYEPLHGGLIKTISGLRSPLTQNHLKASSDSIRQIRRNRRLFRAEAILQDVNPFRQCCINSGKCNDYTSHVVIPSCEYYKAPKKCSSYGDPHIKTLDGLQYTYNGLGDYHLVYTADLKIQGRTCLANSDPNAKATVFCGFALTELEQPTVELYYHLRTQNVVLLVDGTQQNLTTSTFGDVEVLYDINTSANPIVTFDFLSGASVEVEIFSDMLQSVVSIPDDVDYNTTGLLGTLNDNIEDELKSFHGTILSINSTEEEIYYKFGNTWVVAYNESLFSQNHTGLNRNFVPTFLTTINELFQNNSAILVAEKVCGDFSTDRECFFDLAVSNSQELALNGKNFIDEADEVNQLINLEEPKVYGPALLNVTHNQRFNFDIKASSNTSTNLTYFIKTNFTSSIQLLDEKTGSVQLTPVFLNETLEIGVIDEFGLSAVLQPKILYCYCLNNGMCDYKDLEYEEAYITGIYLSFVQCVCKKGFVGSHCEDEIDVCEADPCFVNVSCSSSVSNSQNVAICGACPNGFTGDGRKCYDVDDCLTSPCQQICTNKVGSYSCNCFPGYKKFNLTHCEDVNECNNAAICQKSYESCINTEGSYECRCLDGYRRNSSGVCIDVDECVEQTDNCQQTCVNKMGGFTCACQSGFSLNSDNRTCNDINECSSNVNNCHSNASCVNTNGGFQCSCKFGFTGNGTACEDIDECMEANRVALNVPACTSLCNNTVGSYKCSCQPGFQLSLDQVTCQPINPCLSDRELCHPNATCSYVAANAQCTCNLGFTGNGSTCTDTDECKGDHGCQDICTDIVGSYICSCQNGYTLNADGKTCSDVNECIFGSYSCQNHSVCQNTNGGYVCNCNPGYEKKNSNCIDINECKQNTSGCSQICNNTDGSFVCSCQPGYQENNKQCLNINECVVDRNVCHDNATCSDTVGSYTCSCKDGYIGDGKNCEDINECNGNHGCFQNCVNTGGSFFCSCRTGYTLQIDGKTCLEDNECILGTANCNTNETCFNEPEGSFTCRGLCPGNCEQLCNDTALGYQCYCRQGYQPMSTQKNKCENVNECINSELNTCHSSAVCIDTIGSFYCQCPQGFTGDGKSLCIETTSTPYTTNSPNQVKIVSANITLYDITFNGGTPSNQNAGALVSNIVDDNGLSDAIQQALYQTYLQLEATTLSVEVLSLKNTSSNLKVQYRVRFRDTFTTPLNVLQNRLLVNFQDNLNVLSHNNIRASVVPSSILIQDEDECSTGLHRCHSNAYCTNTVTSYTCTCKSNYKGDGFTCTSSSDDTETLIAVLVSVVVGLLLLIIVIVVFLVVRRKRRKEIEEADSVDGGSGGSSLWSPHHTGKLRARSMYLPKNVVTTEFRNVPDY